MTAPAIPLADQVAALARVMDDRAALNRGRVARQQLSQLEATTEALQLDAALRTLRWLDRHADAVRAAAGEAVPGAAG